MTNRRFAFAMMAVGAMLIGLTGNGLAQDQGDTTMYRAELSAVNPSLTGSEVSGEAVLTISGDELTIRITVEGVAPNMMHLQHFHGFVTGNEKAHCPTLDQDMNGDGIIDLIETEPVAGTTMVPFHDDPVNMEIVNDTYPVADANGTYTYEKTVSLSALETAFAEQFPDSNGKLDLQNRVIFLHGIPESQELPDTVASLGDIPAQVTIPIACGELEMVNSEGTPVASPASSPVATPVS